MKKNLFTILCCSLLPLVGLAQLHSADHLQKIAPSIRADFQRGAASDILVLFHGQPDVAAAQHLKGKNAKAQHVFQQLQIMAERSQHTVRQLLAKNGAHFNSFYIVNAIAVQKCSQKLAFEIAQLPEVKAIAPDPDVFFEGANWMESEKNTAARGQIEWGVQRVKAPEMWARNFSGQGVTIGGADTGYEWGHPALKKSYRGYFALTDTVNHNYNWYDAIHEKSPLNQSPDNPCGYNSPRPCDDNSHGTHTMGTMTGLDETADNQIGVAPAARWIGCRNMERGWGKPSSYIECFEWFLAPSDTAGKNPRPEMAPHVVNNSWYCADIEGCVDISVNELIHTAVQNLRASGVVVVVSNGNSGPNCATGDNAPAYFEESFSVGATREDGRVATFSSRGPVLIDGSERVKPNVCAPGQSVRSSVPGGGYAHFSGTSMAGPHVAGVVALLISAHPELAGEVDIIEDLLEQSARFMTAPDTCLGIAGGNTPNFVCGFGEVDALLAHELYQSISTQQPTFSQANVQVFPNPASDFLFLKIKNSPALTDFQLLDVSGKLVFQQKLGQGEHYLRLPVGHLSKGVYFWKVGTAAGKVILN